MFQDITLIILLVAALVSLGLSFYKPAEEVKAGNAVHVDLKVVLVLASIVWANDRLQCTRFFRPGFIGT